MNPPTAVPDPVGAFIDALAGQDSDALAATCRPDVAFRALAPGESVVCGSAGEVATVFRRWFGTARRIEVNASEAAPVMDRIGFGYRLRLHDAEGTRLVEQRAYADVEDGQFAALDLVCSGFRPETAAAAAEHVHRFDAGALGCGTGLPREFRARIGLIPVGDVLEVVARDPSAREDLPALARMLGHRVRSAGGGPDGTFIIQVERAK